MSKGHFGKDLSLVLKGLGKLGATAVEHNNQLIYKKWSNSSLKPFVENTFYAAQSPVNISKTLTETQLSNRISETFEKLSVVGESFKYFSEMKSTDTSDDLNFEYGHKPDESNIDKDLKNYSTKTKASLPHNQVTNIIGENSSEHFLKDLDVAVSPGYISTAQNISEVLDERSSEIKRKLSELPSLFETNAAPSEGITDEQLEAIGKKLSELQSSEYTEDLKAFQDVKSKENNTVKNLSSTEVDKETKKVYEMKKDVRSIPKPKLIGNKPLAKDKAKSTLSSDAQARKVPKSRISRLVTFGGLAAGLSMGTLAEMTRRTLGVSNPTTGEALLDASPFLTEANAKRIVDTLCKVRGAALKLGQMLSIQDNSLINPHLQKIFERVRQSADFMPPWQLERTLVKDFGPDWKSKLFSFDERPFAAASLGQVHQAMLHDGRSVAMKIQYPGVAAGIESDINNLISTLSVANVLPEGLFLDALIEVAKRELRWECDYIREKQCTKRFRKLLESHSEYYVPEVIEEFCTQEVFTAELIDGIPVDKCVSFDQETRNYIASLVLNLCLMEIFKFGFMQTDPNWSNFFYNQDTNQIALLDFGACRDFSKKFVDKYIQVIHGAATRDREKICEYSTQLGFLTGHEAKVMVDAHVDAVMILGEAFQHDKPFHFGSQDTTKRIQQLVPIMLSHRMRPPPEESYSLHRKMSGVFLLCAKLNAVINCKSFFYDIWDNYKTGEPWPVVP